MHRGLPESYLMILFYVCRRQVALNDRVQQGNPIDVHSMSDIGCMYVLSGTKAGRVVLHFNYHSTFHVRAPSYRQCFPAGEAYDPLKTLRIEDGISFRQDITWRCDDLLLHSDDGMSLLIVRQIGRAASHCKPGLFDKAVILQAIPHPVGLEHYQQAFHCQEARARLGHDGCTP